MLRHAGNSTEHWLASYCRRLTANRRRLTANGRQMTAKTTTQNLSLSCG